MEQDLIKIINISIFAPSGDNSQPWKFKIKNNIISVYNVPEKDTSLYNFNMYASMIAIGALLENIKISATHFDYICEIKINDNFSNNLIAECIFTKNLNKEEDSLFKYIKNRQTNRKPYKKDKINKDIIDELQDYKSFSDVNLKVIIETELINELANACSVTEQIVLENRKLHDFLFEHITWTEKEDKIKRGFYIKTLELKGPQNLVFKLLQFWKINKFLNRIGISKFISKDNAKLYSQSGAMLAITTNKINQISFLKTGMFIQRLWLIATKHNIYIQPLTGIIFLNHRINNKDNKEQFDNKHIELIKASYNKIEQIINSNNEFITIMFRLGYAEEPSVGTKRQEAEIKIEK
jgi:hypothetical protein